MRSLHTSRPSDTGNAAAFRETTKTDRENGYRGPGRRTPARAITPRRPRPVRWLLDRGNYDPSDQDSDLRARHAVEAGGRMRPWRPGARLPLSHFTAWPENYARGNHGLNDTIARFRSFEKCRSRRPLRPGFATRMR